MNDLAENVAEFLADCRARGHSAATLETYTYALRKLRDWASSQDLNDVTQVKRSHMRAYAEHVCAQLRPGGAHARLRPVKTFFRWLEGEEVISSSPMTRVSLPKLPRERQPDVDARAVRALIAATRITRHPLRDAALIAIMFDTGLRAAEVCGIELAHVHAASIEVARAKGGKFRAVPVSRPALKYLRKYVALERPESPYREVFLNRVAEPFQAKALGRMLDRLCEDARLPHVSPHMLRRGFAVEFLRGEGDVFSLQRIMGHSTLEMSNRYAQLLDDDLGTVHRVASPLRRALR